MLSATHMIGGAAAAADKSGIHYAQILHIEERNCNRNAVPAILKLQKNGKKCEYSSYKDFSGRFRTIRETRQGSSVDDLFVLPSPSPVFCSSENLKGFFREPAGKVCPGAST